MKAQYMLKFIIIYHVCYKVGQNTVKLGYLKLDGTV